MSTTTLQTLVNAITSLARRNGAVDKDIKEKLLQIRSDMSDVTASVAATRAALGNIPASISSLEDDASDLEDRADAIIAQVAAYDANAAQVISGPTITSNDSVSTGSAMTFVLAASSLLQNTTITQYVTTINDSDSKTTTANSSGAANVSHTITAAAGSTVTFKAVAYDSLGNTKTATKTISVTA